MGERGREEEGGEKKEEGGGRVGERGRKKRGRKKSEEGGGGGILYSFVLFWLTRIWEPPLVLVPFPDQCYVSFPCTTVDQLVASG